MTGRWPTLNSGADEDAMCVIDAKTGNDSEGAAMCVVTDKTNTATITYACDASQWTALLTATIDDAGFAATDGSLTTWDFASAGCVAQTVDVDGASGFFEGFQKWYCEDYSSSVYLECRHWQIAEATASYPRFSEPDSNDVYFFWIDGSATANTDKYYPQTYPPAEKISLTFSGANALFSAVVAVAVSATLF